MRIWVCLELVKDTDERGRSAGAVTDVLEDELEALIIDADGVPYAVTVLGSGATADAAAASVTARRRASRNL